MRVDRFLILFPGALGDLLCCWPALAALRLGATVTVLGRTPGLALLEAAGIATGSLDRREIADLFAAGPIAPETAALFGGWTRIVSFTGHTEPQVAARLRAIAAGTVEVHPFRGMAVGEHASAYYARCLGVAPRDDRLPLAEEAQHWAAQWCEAAALRGAPLVVHPGSGAARKNWRGMAALAARWRAERGSVVALFGDAEPLDLAIPADAVLRAAPLPHVAAVLAHVGRYVGNDSGISHLAGQLDIATCAVFGDTDARTWRPLGPHVQVIQARRAPCPICGPDILCEHRASVDEVFAALS